MYQMSLFCKLGNIQYVISTLALTKEAIYVS